MGYNTDFSGAIRITPRIAEPLAERLEQWMKLRHMRRDVSALETLYATEEERKAHTLFGDGIIGLGVATAVLMMLSLATPKKKKRRPLMSLYKSA